MIALIPISARKARDPRLKGGSLSQPRGVRPWEVLDPPAYPQEGPFAYGGPYLARIEALG